MVEPLDFIAVHTHVVRVAILQCNRCDEWCTIQAHPTETNDKVCVRMSEYARRHGWRTEPRGNDALIVCPKCRKPELA